MYENYMGRVRNSSAYDLFMLPMYITRSLVNVRLFRGNTLITLGIILLLPDVNVFPRDPFDCKQTLSLLI